MSIFIKAGLWTSKKLGYKGELNLDLFVENKIATTPATLPYKVYTAFLTQTGSSDPVPSIYPGNTIGNIIWEYIDIGVRRGTLPGAFLEGKTEVTVTTYSSTTGSLFYSTVLNFVSEDYIEYNTLTNSIITQGSSDNINVLIEIRVYN
jgi:hypothetical protein